MLNDAGRSFGHWRDAPKKRSAKADASQDHTSTSRPGAQAGEQQTDAVRENLETIAGRRQKRDRLIEAAPSAPQDTSDLRETLERLAERKRKGAEQGDPTEPMWDRVIELAKPLVNREPGATPPHSPAPPPSGPQRRTPGR
jgi:hypothetical protein